MQEVRLHKVVVTSIVIWEVLLASSVLLWRRILLLLWIVERIHIPGVFVHPPPRLIVLHSRSSALQTIPKHSWSGALTEDGPQTPWPIRVESRLYLLLVKNKNRRMSSHRTL